MAIQTAETAPKNPLSAMFNGASRSHNWHLKSGCENPLCAKADKAMQRGVASARRIADENRKQG